MTSAGSDAVAVAWSPISRTCWAASGGAASSRAATNPLSQGEPTGDPDVRGERVEDRAVLLDGEIDRPPGLGLVQSLAREVILQVNRGVPPRLLFPALPARLQPEFLEGHSHLLQYDHDVRAGAGSGGEQERQHRAWRDGVVAVDRRLGSFP